MIYSNQHINIIPLAQSEAVLSVDDLHRDLRSIKIGRVALACHARTETTQTSLRILFAQTEGAFTATVTTSSFTVGLITISKMNQTIGWIHFNSYTLQEQVRPSAQSERREPRGSHEHVAGRLPSGRQSLDVPCVASPVYPASQSSHSSPVVWSRQFCHVNVIRTDFRNSHFKSIFTMQTPVSASHSLECPLQLHGSQRPK